MASVQPYCCASSRVASSALRAREMPRPFKLTDTERSALVAFLESLSSDSPPRPSLPSSGARTISQRDRMFTPAAVKVRRGDRITILNDDTRAHNVRIAGPSLDFNSGLQEPGESVILQFDNAGSFEAHCGIHPTMRLIVDVE